MAQRFRGAAAPIEGSRFRSHQRGVEVDTKKRLLWRRSLLEHMAPLGWLARTPRRLARVMEPVVSCCLNDCSEPLREAAPGKNGALA